MFEERSSNAVGQGSQVWFETRMLHAGHIPDPHVGARAVPIYQTTSYVFQDTDQAADLFDLKLYGNLYTRISNPTTAVFEERLASLENGTGTVALASGMAAQFAVFMTLLEPGDEIVASAQLYGGTVTQLTHTLKKLSIGVRFVDPSNLSAWEEAITRKTRCLFGETIGNPGGSVLDLEALAALADSRHIPLIVDNTLPHRICAVQSIGARRSSPIRRRNSSAVTAPVLAGPWSIPANSTSPGFRPLPIPRLRIMGCGSSTRSVIMVS